MLDDRQTMPVATRSPPAAIRREGRPMNAHPHPARDTDFEAMKDLARLSWLLNFEATATVAGSDTAVAEECA